MTLEEFADKYKRRRAEWLAVTQPQERPRHQFRGGRDVRFGDRYTDALKKGASR